MSTRDAGFLKFFGTICLIPFIAMVLPPVSEKTQETLSTLVILVVLMVVLPLCVRVWRCW